MCMQLAEVFSLVFSLVFTLKDAMRTLEEILKRQRPSTFTI